MPRSWYDFHANRLPDGYSDEDAERRDFNLRILADKKPYFMRYIYPALMKDYNTYMKNTKVKCLLEFRTELQELLDMDESDRTQKQNEFIYYYQKRIPVGVNDCVMNRICRRFEAEFDGFLKLKASKEDFDYSILKSDAEYAKSQYYAVSKLYIQHSERLQSYKHQSKKMRIADTEYCEFDNMMRLFTEECLKICSNSKVLCNIVVDLCYSRIGSQQFAWDVCGSDIYENLLSRNDYRISFPEMDDGGDVYYGGHRFSMKEVKSKYERDYIE